MDPAAGTEREKMGKQTLLNKANGSGTVGRKFD
jgi:hypothetical protein